MYCAPYLGRKFSWYFTDRYMRTVNKVIQSPVHRVFQILSFWYCIPYPGSRDYQIQVINDFFGSWWILGDVFLHLVIENKPVGMVLITGLTIKRSWIIMLGFLILRYSWYTLHKIPYLTLFLWVEILWKQTVSTEFRTNRKFPLQKIRWNYSILRCNLRNYVNRLEITIPESNKYLQYFVHSI